MWLIISVIVLILSEIYLDIRDSFNKKYKKTIQIFNYILPIAGLIAYIFFLGNIIPNIFNEILYSDVFFRPNKIEVPRAESKIAVDLTNNNVYPVFDVRILVELEEGPLKLDDVNFQTNGFTIPSKMIYDNKEKKAEYSVESIDPRKAMVLILKINGYGYDKSSRINVSVKKYAINPNPYYYKGLK